MLAVLKGMTKMVELGEGSETKDRSLPTGSSGKLPSNSRRKAMLEVLSGATSKNESKAQSKLQKRRHKGRSGEDQQKAKGTSSVKQNDKKVTIEQAPRRAKIYFILKR